MNFLTSLTARRFAAVLLCSALSTVALPTFAADAPAAPAVRKPAPKPAPKPAKKPAAKPVKAPVPVELVPEAASDEQRSVAERVYYGDYECDFKQVIHIVASPRYPAYVDLRFGAANYLMKPVLSSTGAVRLEDVRGQTLMIQIASKSMLMNVKTGTRLVDECVSPRHREEMELAKQAAARAAAEPGHSASANDKLLP